MANGVFFSFSEFPWLFEAMLKRMWQRALSRVSLEQPFPRKSFDGFLLLQNIERLSSNALFQTDAKKNL